MSKWPKYRIYGLPNDCRVQVAYGEKGAFWKREPRWLTPLGVGSFGSVEAAEAWCDGHRRRMDNDENTIKVVE